MRTKIRLQLVLFLFAVLLLILNTRAASASPSTFVIEPGQQATVGVNLSVGNGVSSTLVGNLLVTNGSGVNFCVTSPSGVVSINDSNITNSSFSLDAKENGNYSMDFSNPYSTKNVTVILNYGVDKNLVIVSTLGISSSLGVAKIVPPPPQSQPSPDTPDSDYETYLIFLVDSKINEIVQEGLVYMPIRFDEVLAAIGCIIVGFGLGIVAQQPSLKKCRKAILLTASGLRS